MPLILYSASHRSFEIDPISLADHILRSNIKGLFFGSVNPLRSTFLPHPHSQCNVLPRPAHERIDQPRESLFAASDCFLSSFSTFKNDILAFLAYSIPLCQCPRPQAGAHFYFPFSTHNFTPRMSKIQKETSSSSLNQLPIKRQ